MDEPHNPESSPSPIRDHGGARQPPPATPRRERRGIWGVLIGSVVLLTTAAALFVPGLQEAVNRSRQKRSMSDMRALGTALGSYQIDHNGYPQVDDPAALVAALAKYLDAPMRLDDGWGRPWSYEGGGDGGGFFTTYTLTSGGSDREQDGYRSEIVRSFDCDIIYNDGQFVQSPEGIKKSSDLPLLRMLDLDSRRLEAPDADALWARIAEHRAAAGAVSAATRAVIASKNPSAGAGELQAMTRRFEHDLAADTLRNELLLQPRVQAWLAAGGAEVATLDGLDARVQRDLFLAPASDPWVGLVPRSLEATPHRWVDVRETQATAPEARTPDGALRPAAWRGIDGAALVHADLRSGRPPVRRAAASGGRDARALAAAATDPDADMASAAVEELRALGPAGLDAFLALHGSAVDVAAAAPSSARSREARRLLAALDAVAMQRDAHATRLFWYTELDAALRAARETGRSVLSLRLLGKLDEELSCANSRFFRTTLYVDPDVRRELAERFVLHWHSVRPIPKVTIDFGDGRILRQTIAGNSVHYVLDREGRPVEALPGMNGPAVFLSWLRRSAALAAEVSDMTPEAKDESLRRYHQGRLELLSRARAGELGALDEAMFSRAGLPLSDPYLGAAPSDVFTGIDEELMRPAARAESR